MLVTVMDACIYLFVNIFVSINMLVNASHYAYHYLCINLSMSVCLCFICCHLYGVWPLAVSFCIIVYNCMRITASLFADDCINQCIFVLYTDSQKPSMNKTGRSFRLSL